MAISEHNALGGRLTIVIYDNAGAVVERRKISNLITTAGKELLANYVTGKVIGEPIINIAVGGEDKPPDVRDTALRAPLADALAEVIISHDTDTEGKLQVTARVTATLPAEGGELKQELKEAGVLIHPPDHENPVLYSRTIFPVVTRTGNMEMDLTWELLF
jgi:hypothetical protein